jgi:Zn-dependent protease
MRTLATILAILMNCFLYGAAFELADWHPLQTMAVLAVLNFFAILFHELGHASAFRYVGGTVQKIAVLFAAYDVRKAQFQWSRLPSRGDVGGYVAGKFRPMGKTLKDEIIVSGAGPAANLLTGLFALFVAFIIGPAQPFWHSIETSGEEVRIVAMPKSGSPPGPLTNIPSDAVVEATFVKHDAAMQTYGWHRMGYALLMLFAILSIGLALLNLIPFGGSDGQQILWAMKRRWRMDRR